MFFFRLPSSTAFARLVSALLYTPANGGQPGRKEVSIQRPIPPQRKHHGIHQLTPMGRTIRPTIQGADDHAEDTHSHRQHRTSTPTIVGPDKDMKDVYILSGLVFFLAVVVAAFWYYSQADEAAHSNRSSEERNSADLSQVLKTSADRIPLSEPVPPRMSRQPRWRPGVRTFCTMTFSLKSGGRA